MLDDAPRMLLEPRPRDERAHRVGHRLGRPVVTRDGNGCRDGEQQGDREDEQGAMHEIGDGRTGGREDGRTGREDGMTG